VDDVEVNLLDAEPLYASAGLRLGIAMLGKELGCEENLVPGTPLPRMARATLSSLP
jgi:hypothetical protein